MNNKILIRCFIRKSLLILAIFLSNVFFGQDLTPLISREFKPSIGIGTGYFTYFGEVNHRNQANPFSGQLGTMIELARGVSSTFDIGLKVTTGKLSGNERTLERNLNFQTDIFIGEAKLAYNFYPFVDFDSKIHPFMAIGFESFEFNPKGDLLDANGEEYHYWSDGSIRNLSESDPLSSTATRIHRDYVYESDLREQNLDGIGKYPLVALGIPISGGFNLEVSDRVRFKLNSTYHFSLSDNIDNISSAGSGNRMGNSNNDNFLFTSISLHYDFLIPPTEEEDGTFEFPDFFAFDDDDYDQDGVPDFLDSCALTPEGIEVYENGCPIDGDNDGVPNFRDDELFSEELAIVNQKGVELTDGDYFNWYLEYMDSLDIPIEVISRMNGTPKRTGLFRVRIARVEGRIPEDQVGLFLAEDDLIANKISYNVTDYITQQYSGLEEAKARRDGLIDKGLTDSEVIVQYGDKFITLNEYLHIVQQDEVSDSLQKENILSNMEGKFVKVIGNTAADANTTEKAKFYPDQNTIQLEDENNGHLYINGVYDSKTKGNIAIDETKSTFPDATIKLVHNGELVDPSSVDLPTPELKENTLGKFNNQYGIIIDSISTEKTNQLVNEDAIKTVIQSENKENEFLSNFSDNKENVNADLEKLKSLGVNNARIVKIENGVITEIENNQNPLQKSEDEFTVLLGEYDDTVPEEVINKILSVDNIKSTTQGDPSVTTYTSGEYDNKEDAKQRLIELKENGFNGAKVVQKQDGKFVEVPLNEIFNPEEITEINKVDNTNQTIEESTISTDETVFRVQLGAYRNNVSNSIFKGVDVIAFPSDNGITKFVTGSFENYQTAHIHKQKMQQIGFSDAFVVGYKDGKRVPVSQLINPADYKKLPKNEEEEEVVKPEENENPITANKNYYSIQIGAFQSDPEKTFYSNLEEVRVEKDQGVSKVVVGELKTFEHALTKQEELIDKGYSSAFIVKYLDRKRIEVVSGTTNNQVNYTKDLVVIKVQLGSFNEEVPQKLRDKFDELREVEYLNEAASTKVTSGKFNNYNSAKEYKELMISKGFQDAFLIAYYNNEKINLQKAIRILEKQD